MSAVSGKMGVNERNVSVVSDEPIVTALKEHLLDNVVSLVMQYQIDEFIKEVNGNITQLSVAKQAAVKAAAQGVTF